MNPAAAAVSIFCLLIISWSLVSSAPTTVEETPASLSGSALFAKIDGHVVAQCSVKWAGGYSTNGKKLYLIANSKDVCYECEPCTASGIHCEKMSRSCPIADVSESSGSGSGEDDL